MNRSDAELVAAYKHDKNKKAFGQIYERYVDDVYRYVYARLDSTLWTEDIVADTFMTLIDVLPNFEGKSSLKTFIIGIALNKMRTLWRQQSTRADIDFEDYMVDEEALTGDFDMMNADEKRAEAEVEAKKLDKKLDQVMAKLNARYRKVLDLRFNQGLSVAETAEALGTTPASTRVLQHRALKQATEIANQLIEQEQNQDKNE